MFFPRQIFCGKQKQIPPPIARGMVCQLSFSHAHFKAPQPLIQVCMWPSQLPLLAKMFEPRRGVFSDLSPESCFYLVQTGRSGSGGCGRALVTQELSNVSSFPSSSWTSPSMWSSGVDQSLVLACAHPFQVKEIFFLFCDFCFILAHVIAYLFVYSFCRCLFSTFPEQASLGAEGSSAWLQPSCT